MRLVINDVREASIESSFSFNKAFNCINARQSWTYPIKNCECKPILKALDDNFKCILWFSILFATLNRGEKLKPTLPFLLFQHFFSSFKKLVLTCTSINSSSNQTRKSIEAFFPNGSVFHHEVVKPRWRLFERTPLFSDVDEV